jgi:hypothetical protein
MTEQKSTWNAPKLQRLVARSAETGGSGKNDAPPNKS